MDDSYKCSPAPDHETVMINSSVIDTVAVRHTLFDPITIMAEGKSVL